MTAVIGASSDDDYRHHVPARDDIQRVAAALDKPRKAYMKQLETLRTELVARSGEAARQLYLFADRVGELTLEEIRELYDATFLPETLTDIGPLSSRLSGRSTSGADARAALTTLVPMLDRLEADRNPFAHVLRALCCLLVRASH